MLVITTKVLSVNTVLMHLLTIISTFFPLILFAIIFLGSGLQCDWHDRIYWQRDIKTVCLSITSTYILPWCIQYSIAVYVLCSMPVINVQSVYSIIDYVSVCSSVCVVWTGTARCNSAKFQSFSLITLTNFYFTRLNYDQQKSNTL